MLKGHTITAWFERPFPPVEDAGRFPSLVERLRGAIIRVQHKAEQYPVADLQKGPLCGHHS